MGKPIVLVMKLNEPPTSSPPPSRDTGRYLLEEGAEIQVSGRCDGCGREVEALRREAVEGVICERCDECREAGVVP